MHLYHIKMKVNTYGMEHGGQEQIFIRGLVSNLVFGD